MARQSGGIPVLLDGGVNKLRPLVCGGTEDSGGWKGTSWGFIYTRGKIMFSRGALGSYLGCLPAFTDSHITVTGIYTKTGGKNSKYSRTRNVTNISGVATVHVQLFRQIFRDRYSETHNQPMPGIRRFEVIAPWQFLCTASAPTFSHTGEAILAPCDYTTFKALEQSVSSIGGCMSNFAEKRGQKAGEEDDSADADE